MCRTRLGQTSIFLIQFLFALVHAFSAHAGNICSREPRERQEIRNRIESCHSSKLLDLKDFQISDQDLDWIVEACSEIQSLNLSKQTMLSFEKAKRLAQLPELRFLNLSWSTIDHGLDLFLKERNPRLVIKRDSLFPFLTVNEEVISCLRPQSCASISKDFSSLARRSAGVFEVSINERMTVSLLKTRLEFFLKNPDGLPQPGRLSKIDLGNSKIDFAEEDLEWIVDHFPRLTSLTLSLESGITNRSLAAFKRLIRLQFLNLSIPSITPQLSGLSKIGQLSDLKLRLSVLAKVKDEDLEHLKNLTNLTSFSYIGNKITDRGLSYLSNLNALRFVDLWGEITDEGLKHFQNLSHLTSLRISSSRITDMGLEILSTFPSLTSLTLWSSQITNKGVAHLTRSTRLTSLELWSDQLSSDGIIHIGKLTKLEKLRLPNYKINDDDLEPLIKLSNLTHLWLPSAHYTDAQAYYLLNHLNQLNSFYMNEKIYYNSREILCLREELHEHQKSAEWHTQKKPKINL